MASTTPNIGLTLPTGAEKVSRQVINTNNTIIDSKIGAVPPGQNLQGEINTLNSNIANMVSSKYFNKAAASSANITVPTLSRHLLIITTNGAASRWIGYVQASSAGALTLGEIDKGASASVTTSTNTLTISIDADRDYAIADFIIYGDACS